MRRNGVYDKIDLSSFISLWLWRGISTMTQTQNASPTPRDACVNALMALAAQRPFADITLSDIAQEAGLSLAQLRSQFPSKGAILGAFTSRIDVEVLKGTSDDLSEESAKDRLFDVLMRRLDAMAPYRAALKNIMDWIAKDPLTAVPLNGQIINSMRYMLEAAGIHSEGPLNALVLQAMALKWADVMRVWIKDEDAGLGASMAALDHMLDDGSQWMERLTRVEQTATRLLNILCTLPHQRPMRRHHAAHETDVDAL